MEFYGRPSVNTIPRYHSSRRPVIYFGKVSFDPDTCDHSMIGGRLFGKWCIRDDIGKVGGCVPLDISNTEIPNDVVKGGLRLPTSDVAKALFESVFKCQARKFGQDRALFVLRNSIKACPQNIHRYSRMGHSDFGLFVKSDGSCGMKRDGIPNNLHLLRRDASPLQKRARRIGAIHLETIFRRVAVSQAQIMQNRGYCQQLGIRSTFSAF